MGPFVDETDGFTVEDGLTISQADIRLSKNGAAFGQTNNSAGATHDENGYYAVPLDTTDTGTLGHLRVAISESGARPVVQDFMVVPENVWDSMFGADLLQVDLVECGGSAVAAGSIPNAAAGASGGVPVLDSGLSIAAIDADLETIKAKTNLIPAAGPADAAHYTPARAAKLDDVGGAVSSVTGKVTIDDASIQAMRSIGWGGVLYNRKG